MIREAKPDDRSSLRIDDNIKGAMVALRSTLLQLPRLRRVELEGTANRAPLSTAHTHRIASHVRVCAADPV